MGENAEIINKSDLAPHVQADLEVMKRDAGKQRKANPFLFTNAKSGKGCDEISQFIIKQGGL